jgi:hypothetical protein
VAPFDLRQLTMSLRPLSDTSAADWFVDAEADAWTKVCLGPPGYKAYARLQLIPADEDSEVDLALLTAQALRRILPRHTTTPDDCYFGQWDGSGWPPPLPPAPEQVSLMYEPAEGLRASMREYHLYAGTLDDSSAWASYDCPHLMWPADHAWFAAKDVDPDWIGVGGTQALIDELVGDARLDVAPTTYDATDWEVR